MKRFLAPALLSIALMVPGCTGTTVTPSLAPGYLTPADQQMGEILAGAHAFYTTIQQESASGQMTLSPAEKTAFNAFGVSLNAAQAIYLAYHANPTPANLQSAQVAVNQVQQQQAALPTPAVK